MSQAQNNPAATPIVIYKNRISARNKMGRLLWGIVYWMLFRPSPRQLYGWRRFLLRCFGAKIGPGAVIHPSVKIWAPWNLSMDDHACLAFDVTCYCVDKVAIGARAVVSQGAHLCTGGHDLSTFETPLVTGPIDIGRNAWVFAEAFVGPGVTIGEGAVAAARAVVVKSVDPWTVVGGNPAKFIQKREMRDAPPQ